MASPSSTPTHTTANTVTPPIIREPLLVKRSARARVHHNSAWISEATRELTAPWRASPLGTAASVVPRAAVASRNGVLLLLGAVALTVLALASGSMLRLLGRMDEVQPR